MMEGDTPKRWSESVAALIVDALRDAKIVSKEHNDRAIAVASEEIYARLCVRDYPPAME
jgi:hypothetical protein